MLLLGSQAPCSPNISRLRCCPAWLRGEPRARRPPAEPFLSASHLLCPTAPRGMWAGRKPLARAAPAGCIPSSPPCLPLGSCLVWGASLCCCQGRLQVQAGQVDPTSKSLLCLLVAPSAWLYIPCFTLGCFLVLARPGRSSALRPCSSLPRNHSTPANRADGTRGPLDSTLLELATGCSC